VILLLLVMSVKMASYWGKGGILWLSYLLNEFGDPDFFVWFYFKCIINSMPGKFQHILISGTITAELPWGPFPLRNILEQFPLRDKNVVKCDWPTQIFSRKKMLKLKFSTIRIFCRWKFSWVEMGLYMRCVVVSQNWKHIKNTYHCKHLHIWKISPTKLFLAHKCRSVLAEL
jgi:hypothetical protein